MAPNQLLPRRKARDAFRDHRVYSNLPTLPREAQSQTKYSQEHTGLPEALQQKNKSNTKKKL